MTIVGDERAVARLVDVAGARVRGVVRGADGLVAVDVEAPATLWSGAEGGTAA